MQTVYFKEAEGSVQNSVGQMASVTTAPWWSALGSQSIFGESCGQIKPFSLELPNYVDQLAPTKQAGRGAEQVFDKGHTTQFSIFPDDCKIPGDPQKPQAAISLPDPSTRVELGFSQPMGRIMLPLNMTSDDGPIYVNAKQYHGIIRRRQSRAKAVLQNKLTKRRKPYMHESRHLHAMRRPRGCGGRFLNTRNMDNSNEKSGSEVNKTGDGQLQYSGSQSSEVLQSSKETSGSSPRMSGSEVTSMYSRGGFNHGFAVNHLGSAVHHSLADMMGGHGGGGIVIPTKWVAAADQMKKLLLRFPLMVTVTSFIVRLAPASGLKANHSWLIEIGKSSLAHLYRYVVLLALAFLFRPVFGVFRHANDRRINSLYFTPSSFSITVKFPHRPLSHKPLNLNFKSQFPTSSPLSLYHLPLASAAFDGFEVAQDTASAQQEDPQPEPYEKSEEEEEDAPKVSDSNEAGRLYVGNLPYALTSSELAEIFRESGNVVSVEIVYDRVTDRSRGFAFVTMESAEDAKEAIRMFDGSQIGGRTVKVNFPEVPKGGERLVMGPKVKNNYRGFIESPHKIYAGNLGWGLTSQGLRDAFAEQPGFLSAKVIYERDTGRSRGFGFVSFQTAEDVETALNAMNGVEVEGRPLRLNLAADRTSTSSPYLIEEGAEDNVDSSELVSSVSV
ncbi:33 kDa ribonucleoprotein, chloroplastic [Senna tora]|uniref:Nuclear transcription factor Y subunit n=1 Tax=Senna tora TaxID=362788 RepID=A0A834TJY0_9FABA|nr:33 kDa ribonucleoprotein, chloroplastic [Senna tora]